MSQKGRSMIEMLGVLTIIGVLSVGALEGYSRAMFKHKLNKQAEQINTLIATVTQNFKKFQSMPASTTITSYFIKMGEIPQNMILNGNTSYVYDVFGMGWRIFIASFNGGIYLSSYSDFSTTGVSPLTTKSDESLAICKNLLLTIKEHRSNIRHTTLYSNNLSENTTKRFEYYGDNYCSPAKKCLSNLTLEDIHKVCTDHLSDKSIFEVYWEY